MKFKAQLWLQQAKPFVIYRKPNQVKQVGWFQQNDELHTTTVLNNSCFAFAPFATDDIVYFPIDKCEILTDENYSVSDHQNSDVTNNVDDNAKHFHINLVGKAIDTIKNSTLEKVVISRCEKVSINSQEYPTYFNRLLNKYPTAFVYWFYHPKVGMWMGATPEKLLQYNDNEISTVALAGTQIDQNLDTNAVVWGAKEKKEQQIVTDFIVDAIKPFSQKIETTLPYTHKAGSLLHIKTDIKATVESDANLFNVVNALHPTPALCGYPKNVAKQFIIDNEGYNREFYGGYLGEWMVNNSQPSTSCDLFVNLRCMKIENTNAYLYLGGGINAESIPENEFIETVNKSKTIKSVL